MGRPEGLGWEVYCRAQGSVWVQVVQAGSMGGGVLVHNHAPSSQVAQAGSMGLEGLLEAAEASPGPWSGEHEGAGTNACLMGGPPHASSGAISGSGEMQGSGSQA